MHNYMAVVCVYLSLLIIFIGIPLPIVATAVGIAHDDYGTDDL